MSRKKSKVEDSILIDDAVTEVIASTREVIAFVLKDFNFSSGGARPCFCVFRKGTKIRDQKVINQLKASNAPIEILEV